ncbi:MULTISPECIES: ketoacyl-ACP synthase III family protein [unclassified Streptomyces]|uniref:ketoacyl-ACP synthase III family protein n=1 Tax=unclassified Streptomyces TaxID=2593676 RepID=UPI0003651D70|nr:MULTISPECIES: ketoacyl-ACP synthase III family protein [unclassified Streptomyces]MYT33824.1 hypothetical protein [Streptomyces sp. SID8354]
MQTPDIWLAGIGAYVPESFSAREAVEQGLYDPDEYELYGWTGAAVAGEMPPPDLAIRAARQAMERSGHTSSDIDLHIHVGTYDQGPDGWSAQHYILLNAIGRDVPSYRVWQACNALIGSAELAASYLMAVPGRTAALVTGADNIGRPDFNRWSYGLQNGVLGDAGSALVLSRRTGFARLLAINTTSLSDAEIYYRGSEELFPPSAAKNIRDRLASVGGDAAEALAELVQRQGDVRTELALRTLDEADIGADQVTRVAHQLTAQERYIEQMLAPIGIDAQRGMRKFGQELGHLTVNDQIVGLNHLVESGQVGPGDHVLVMSHGGGTALTCAVVEITGDWPRSV